MKNVDFMIVFFFNGICIYHGQNNAIFTTHDWEWFIPTIKMVIFLGAVHDCFTHITYEKKPWGKAHLHQL